MNTSIDTPCVGVCSTVYGDLVCRGCKRLYQEIIEWNGYKNSEKQGILQRLSNNMSRIVKTFLEVTNPVLLLQKLEHYQIRYHSSDDAYCWAHHLLRVRAARIHDLEEYGIIIKPAYQEFSSAALFALIDKKLYETMCSST